jgi:hypothetical protein
MSQFVAGLFVGCCRCALDVSQQSFGDLARRKAKAGKGRKCFAPLTNVSVAGLAYTPGQIPYFTETVQAIS